jgi:tetratricopeptide (TPR) repeat protein
VLNYWEDGVKGLSVRVGNRRTINERINELRTHLPNNAVVDCTLAEGKRLIEEALSVNAWRNVEASQDYRKHLPILNKLIFQATELGEDSGNTFITPEQETQEVLVNFLGAWTFGDFGLAYDLLTEDCEIRDNLSRDEWIKQHRQWYEEAKPLRMELGFVHDIPAQQGALWLPSSMSRTVEKKDVEVGWSVELLDTPLSGTLKEMPFATAINKETGRSWFWTSYSLIRVNNAWRIQKVVDEGLALQGATTDDLQKRVKEQEELLEQFIQQQRQDPNLNLETFLETVSWRLAQLLHFYDTLIPQLPLDYELCKQAYGSAVLSGDAERKMIYGERMTQRFSEDRADNLRRLGSALAAIGDLDAERGMDARAHHLLKRAEETLREAISIDEDALSYVLLGELLISVGRHAEAETELLKAKERPHTEKVEASIEAGLGSIAMEGDQMAEAITHYQRVSELDADYQDVWFNLGFAHRLLGQMDEAEQNYLRAIEADPQDTRPYGELTVIYGNREELDKAVDLLERGLCTMPSSAILHALLASTLNEQGNRREARHHLATAESINPELKLVQLVKEQMEV